MVSKAKQKQERDFYSVQLTPMVTRLIRGAAPFDWRERPKRHSSCMKKLECLGYDLMMVDWVWGRNLSHQAPIYLHNIEFCQW